MSTPEKIVLKSSDNQTFEVEEIVAMQSQTIKNMIEDDCANNVIPLPNVTGNILAMVVQYCKRHAKAKAPQKSSDDDAAEKSSPSSSSPSSGDDIDLDLKAFDADFVKVEVATLFEIILAANYLDVKSLLDLTCQAVADKIKDKFPDEVRDIFNIKNDFTPEEEEAVRQENAWAFEK